ncbi:hypothetical protein MtrunA17_Chr8g0351591 [Medicago truncatula]|uniref:Uncharacterized protein n=1 Tax=Medicago truncatula TaxID=3880 RepID=A0A396GNA4_MEDTR|nr:hypothetical protein MtrunA17_Chr8g0351591 [Medicago truncatula]
MLPAHFLHQIHKPYPLFQSQRYIWQPKNRLDNPNKSSVQSNRCRHMEKPIKQRLQLCIQCRILTFKHEFSHQTGNQVSSNRVKSSSTTFPSSIMAFFVVSGPNMKSLTCIHLHSIISYTLLDADQIRVFSQLFDYTRRNIMRTPRRYIVYDDGAN